MSDPYVAAILSMRRDKDHAFRDETWSPIEDRAGFQGLVYYPVDPALRLRTRLVRHDHPAPITLQTSDGQARTYHNVGHFDVSVDGQPVRIQAYQQPGSEALFVPFRDQTSGKETYGAGRYLDVHLEAGDEAEVDLNLAYHPYCAYSEAFSCPFPPAENWLQVPLRAGERLAQQG
jgi:uncharacterized protein (DUF1684 family)